MKDMARRGQAASAVLQRHLHRDDRNAIARVIG